MVSTSTHLDTITKVCNSSVISQLTALQPSCYYTSWQFSSHHEYLAWYLTIKISAHATTTVYSLIYIGIATIMLVCPKRLHVSLYMGLGVSLNKFWMLIIQRDSFILNLHSLFETLYTFPSIKSMGMSVRFETNNVICTIDIIMLQEHHNIFVQFFATIFATYVAASFTQYCSKGNRIYYYCRN